MAEEVYIELEVADGEGSKRRVDLAPVNTIEETIVKETYDNVIETYQEDGEDPINLITDFKNIIHSFTITSDITDTPDGGISIEIKKSRLRIQSGIIGNILNTRLLFHYEGDDYNVFMKRLTFTQGGGETFFGVIIELTEGIRVEDQ